VLVTIDSLRADYPAPEPCSAVFCQNAQTEQDQAYAAIGKLLSLLQTSCVDVGSADIRYRNGLHRVDMGGGVVRFTKPQVRREAGS
jgi:hypothetical protein